MAAAVALVAVTAASALAAATLYMGWLEDYYVGWAAVEVYGSGSSDYNLNRRLMYTDSNSPTSWSYTGVQNRSADDDAVTLAGSFLEDRTTSSCGLMITTTTRYVRYQSGTHASKGATCPPATGTWIQDGGDIKSLGTCDWGNSATATRADILKISHEDAHSDYLSTSGMETWAYKVKVNPILERQGNYYDSPGWSCFHIMWDCDN